ncbi:MAG: bifunctional oligoribonuclease/PAP phosphatase NrnA [Aggregatilineales bacterium]
MTISKVDWQSAAQLVENAETILVVTHVSPDGDAIGSLLGMGNALRQLGKKVDVAVDEGVPDFVEFLPGSDMVKRKLTVGEWDLMISVDASDEVRTGKVGAFGRERSKKVINLDHHATNTLFGDEQLVMSNAVSATEVIYHWLDAIDFAFTPDVATPLLAGLVTDTLGFRTSNVTSETLYIAQSLMECGASLTEITERTLDTKSIHVVNLWKTALASAEIYEGGVIAANVTQEDLKRAGLRDVTDGGLVGFLVKVNEAMIAVVFKELADSKVEISLRSKPGYDVSEVAFAVGGGGHKQASGATIDGPLEEARKRILPLLIVAAKKGKLIIA